MEFQVEASTLLEVKCPGENALTISIDPYEMYWKIVEWEESELHPSKVISNVRDAIGGADFPMAYANQVYWEIIRLAMIREDDAKKKIDVTREQIVNSPDSIQEFQPHLENGTPR